MTNSIIEYYVLPNGVDYRLLLGLGSTITAPTRAFHVLNATRHVHTTMRLAPASAQKTNTSVTRIRIRTRDKDGYP